VDTYRSQADMLDLNGNVSFPGRIPYGDAPRFLAVGDVAVAPKLSQTEGAGKIGNYMAMGLPVVAFDTPISHEYLGDLGIYAEPGNSRSLAAQLLAALDSPDSNYHLGLRLREKAVKELSWNEAIAGIEAVYERARAYRSERSRLPVPEHAAPDPVLHTSNEAANLAPAPKSSAPWK
jgi:glycosyltransferase involved in cell wall biosynthesis